jgi:hypothetical protein
MARFNEDRAPLEFTKPSSQKVLLVCPNCKYGRFLSKNTVGVICISCEKYFKSSESLDSAEGMVNSSKPISPEYIKFREEMERKAYDYKEKVMDKRKRGDIRSHEPDNKPRRW